MKVDNTTVLSAGQNRSRLDCLAFIRSIYVDGTILVSESKAFKYTMEAYSCLTLTEYLGVAVYGLHFGR